MSVLQTPAYLAAAERTAATGPRPPLRIAYLLSRYPAISHTFFLHEVQGLRSLGIEIETASINPPDRALDALPPDEAAEAGTTFYVKSSGGALLKTLLAVLLTQPAAVLRGVSAVLRVPRLTLRQRGYWMFYLAEALLVGRWMRQHRLNHLHLHFGGPVASVGMLVAAAWGFTYSLTIHGPEELLNVDANHLREKIASAHFVFCISDFCRSQLLQLSRPEDWDKFEVMRLGVDPAELTPRSHPERAVLELVCTGRLVPEKGHRILLEALDRLRSRGCLIHATLIGGGPERDALESLIVARDLTALVTLTGPLSHAETLARVRDADLFALASFAEGIPVALMEAMTLGVPCVSTTVAGIPELIDSGDDGLLVPPANVEALAAALQALACDPALRERIRQAARKKIERMYNRPVNQRILAHALERHLRRAEDLP